MGKKSEARGYLPYSIIFLCLFSLLMLANAGFAGKKINESAATIGRRGKHRLTGIVSEKIPSEKRLTVKGRRRTATFQLPAHMFEKIELGDRIRVFYTVDESKKNVVTKIKTINNGKVPGKEKIE